MIKIYKTEESIVNEIEKVEDGCWINMITPTMEECINISEQFDIDIADVRAALDDEESSRVDLEDGYTLILVDIPSIEIRHKQEAYTTIPLGIILADGVIITVCGEETPVLQAFEKRRVRDFSTKKKMRFVYQILYRATSVYQNYLRVIDKRRREIEERISDDTEDKDLIDLHELESNLVYFATSLRANGVVLDRLTRYERLKQFPEDREILEDVIVENKQAIEMANIYSGILSSMMGTFASVISNNLNVVMKVLSVITIVMSIPTIVFSAYGMNLSPSGMPFSADKWGFLVVILLSILVSIVAAVILSKKKFF